MPLMLAIEVGEIIAKKYKVIRKIGAGSFGTIFLCKLSLLSFIFIGVSGKHTETGK